MGITLALTAISTLVGIGGANKAAKASELQAIRQARQMRIDRELAKLQARQEQNKRYSDYTLSKASNDAQFSFNIGGGESSSLAAFEQYQSLTKDEDMAMSQMTGFMDSSSRTVAAAIARQRGESARSVARINNMSRLFELGSELSKTYTPTKE